VPSKKVTFPVGVPPALDTVAVNVTGYPAAIMAAEEFSCVVVGDVRFATGISVT
jgi:hypothetical protein